MKEVFSFFCTSILLGVGLAMDAFSVSLVNGLNEPKMNKYKVFGEAGLFSLFQFSMPMIGWVCVSKIAQVFHGFQKFIPWIAFFLLGYIGGKMLYDVFGNNSSKSKVEVGLKGLLIQGFATSIDALSVGFTISEYNLIKALFACFLIGCVTFVICYMGICVGKKAGIKLADKAGILGGIILIFVGLEIFISSFV